MFSSALHQPEKIRRCNGVAPWRFQDSFEQVSALAEVVHR